MAHLTPSDPDVLMRLASINFFSLYEPQSAMANTKQCLHYDPEQKRCKKLHRQMKKIDKDIKKVETDLDAERFATATNNLIGTATRKGVISEIDAPYETLEKELNAVGKMPKRLHLKCYELACKIFSNQKQKDNEKINKWCSATIDIQGDHVDALLGRGEAKLRENDFEAAVRDLEAANEASGGQNNRVRGILQRAQQMLRQSKRRDYYKILGE